MISTLQNKWVISIRKDVNFLCHYNLENDEKFKYVFVP